MLLLDEPNNALDEETEARLIDILNGLDQTLVLISHDAAFREAVTMKSIVLADGQLHDR